MNKYRLFEIMERVNPDMEISHDRMIDLMMDDVKHIQRYENKISDLSGDDIVDILRNNPEPSKAYRMLKDHAKKVLTGENVAHLKAYIPKISEEIKELNYLIDPSDIYYVIKLDKNKIEAFSDLFDNDEWLKENDRGIKNMILDNFPELKDHNVFNRAKVLDRDGIIDIF